MNLNEYNVRKVPGSIYGSRANLPSDGKEPEASDSGHLKSDILPCIWKEC